MNNYLKLAYSTCPNDTFIFYALAHNLIERRDLQFKIELADVETLNQQARAGVFDVSKLSFGAIGHLLDTYGVLRSGSALGRGCGPLIVARQGFNLNQIDSSQINTKKIAVPGMWTTACMLLGLYLSKKPDVVPMRFDLIMPAVESGDLDFGVIIHEGRFTYKNYGLICLLDLGKWWEEKISLPIPLGGIAIRRDIAPETVQRVKTAVRESTLYAFTHRTETERYIKKYAREMSSAVIRRHIDLYVNDFTIEVGELGKEAVEALFEMARNRGILPESKMPVFAC